MSKYQIPFLFYAFPIRLDDDPNLLNQDEKNILAKLIRRGQKGWEFGERTFADNLEIGLYHFRRARSRLFVLGLIRIERRGTQQFTYFFQPDISKWRLPKYLQEKLKNDATKLDPNIKIDFLNHFDSIEHYNNYFVQAFPKFKDGRKGRHKNRESTQILLLGDDQSEQIEKETKTIQVDELLDEQYKKENEKYKSKSQRLEVAHPVKVLADYYYQYQDVQKMILGEINPKHPDKDLFLKLLNEKMGKISSAIDTHDEFSKTVFKELKSKQDNQEDPFAVAIWLDRKWSEYRIQHQRGGA